YRVTTREPRSPLPALPERGERHVGNGNGNGKPNDALVALFREQMAVLQAQTDIIRKQAEALGISAPVAEAHPKPVPVPSEAVPVPAPAPLPPPAPAPAPVVSGPSDDEVESRLMDLVSAVSAFPRSGINPDKKLVGDLGFDSLMVVELAGKANEAFPGLGGL